MRSLLLLFIFCALSLTLRAQAPYSNGASYSRTINPNGTVTFSNTSSSANTNSASITYTFTWDMGNGETYTTTSLSQTVSATYTSNGVYYMRMAMFDPTPNVYTTAADETFTIAIAGCPLTISQVTASPAGIATASFFANVTGTTTGTGYTWNFGDNTTSNLINPVHTYSLNGIFIYTLFASNNATCNAFAQIPGSEVFQGQWPTVICSYTPSLSYTVNPNVPGEVTLSLSATSSPLMYAIVWDYGDGFVWGTNTPVSTHIYFNGSYTPSVSTLGPGQCPHTTILNAPITITNNPCNASSAFTYIQGSTGAVQFSAGSSTVDPNILYYWNFGDGVYSTLANPNHTYSSAGTYSVEFVSYNSAYGYLFGNSAFNSTPCQTSTATTIAITSTSCVANSGFSVTAGFPPTPHMYNIYPVFPYNVANAQWDWGDGTSSSTLLTTHTFSAAGNYSICLTVTASCGAISSTCYYPYLAKGEQDNSMLYVSVQMPQITTGIKEEMTNNLQLELFPNPATDILNIRLSEKTDILGIQVFDLVGNMHYSEATPKNENKIQLDLDELSSGIYFLRIKTTKKTLTSKFIISD